MAYYLLPAIPAALLIILLLIATGSDSNEASELKGEN